MSDNLEKNFELETSPTDKNICIVYKKVDRRNNLDIFYPVAQFPINSGSEITINFYEYPILSDEEKDFVKEKVREFLEEK